MSVTPVPLGEGLFTWPSDDPRLLGSRCGSCDAVAFPASSSCARCASTDVALVELPSEGTLWTFTVQGFPPKRPPYAGPEPFEPYGVGYVDLGEVKVESRLTVAEGLRIGMRMKLVVAPFTTLDDGTPTVMFAFEPVEDR